MSVATVRSPAEYEDRLRKYLFERAEEARAVRVGEKEISERAEIVARYADLFSREQLEALRAAEEGAADGDERERLYRLRKECEAGVADAELSERHDQLENAILAERIVFQGEEMPLRTAQAMLAVLREYRHREQLGLLHGDASAGFNEGRRQLIQAEDELAADLSGFADPIERNEEEKGISLQPLADRMRKASDESGEAFYALRDRWFERLLGPERDPIPASYHMAYMRRLSPLEATYTKERAVEVCMDTLTKLGFDLANDDKIRLDLDDRPQKSPRACVIASDAPNVVHLITRAQGGLHDYQAFLHEAGHALHYAGCDPDLPYTFRNLSRDHALTEIYSFILEAISREPAWHVEHFGLSDEDAATNAESTTFLEALLYRRYAAKLVFELEFWAQFQEGGAGAEEYARRLTAGTGVRYRADGYLADMDAGFYSADYLRAWIRSAQLRATLVRDVGEDWWCSERTGTILRDLFAEGTRPSSEEIAARLGFDPLDTGPLLEELGTS